MDSRHLEGTEYYVARIKELESECLMQKVALERSHKREQTLNDALQGFKELFQKHLTRERDDAVAALQQQNEIEVLSGKLDALVSENQSLRAQVSQLQMLLTSVQSAPPRDAGDRGGTIVTAVSHSDSLVLPEVERLSLLLRERTKALHEAYNIMAAGSSVAAPPHGAHQKLHEAEWLDSSGSRSSKAGPSVPFLLQQNAALSLRVAELEAQLEQLNLDSRFGI